MTCSEDGEGASLLPRTESFLTNRALSALTGPRRMGRENFVGYVAGVARSFGIRVSVFPEDSVKGAEIIIFPHWKDMDEGMIAENPDADILYGQDLCHQVPSVVRLTRRRKSKSVRTLFG